MPAPEWTEAEEKRLATLWNAKTPEGKDLHSTYEIGTLLGKSKNSVVGKAHRMDLPGRASPIKPIGQGRNNNRYIHRAGKTTLPVDGPPLLAAVIPPRPREIRLPMGGPCCWPIGEPGTRAFRYCEDPSLAGKPYCPAHCKVAYVKVKDLRIDARVFR